MNRWMFCAFFIYALQAAALCIDEFFIHRKRNLPSWERWGHPLDTASVLIPTFLTVFFPFHESLLFVFVVLGIFSCLFVTKDEWVHARVCSGLELWLHAVLFVCHPMAFVSTAFFWVVRSQPSFLATQSDAWRVADIVLKGQAVTLAAFLLYQVIYWNFFRGKAFDSAVQLSSPMRQSESADPQQFA
ncbi:MAG: hypothetical protein RIR26_2523 [Pseudomonadota bacterium]